MINIKKFDLFLIILFSTTSLVFLYFISSSSFGRDNSTNEKIGEMKKINSEVFIKGEGEFFYTKAQVGQVILNRDQISTGLSSQALIVLDNEKGQIQLKELSHIVVQKSGSGFQLNIRSGEMDVESTAEVIVVDKEQKLVGQGENRFTYKRNQQGSQVKSTFGNLKASDSQGEKAASVSLAEPLPEPIQLINPQTEAIISDENYRVKFEWNAGDQKLDSFKLKVFDGSKLLISKETQASSKEIDLPYSGPFRWTVEGKRKSQVYESVSQKFTLSERAFFVSMLPEQGAKFPHAEGETTVIDLQWSQRGEVETQLTVEKLESLSGEWQSIFTKTLLAKKIQQESASFSSGKYRWFLKSGEHQSSKNEFEVLERPPVIVAAPPPSQPVVPPKKPARLAVKAIPPVEAEVKPVAKLEPVPEIKPEEKPIETEPPAQAATPVPPDEPKELPKLEAPQIVSPASGTLVRLKEELGEVRIKLQSNGCSEYEIEVARSSKFKKPIILNLDKDNTSTTLAPSIYYIRARCWIDGEAGPWSSSSRFEVQ